MDRLDRLEQVVKKAEKLLAEVIALKGEPSDPPPPVGEPFREIVGEALQEFIDTKGRKD
jgi:hypothetical protein